MKKCCFIIPYFGELPRHFKVFLKTCEYNKEYNWLIFTDDKTNYKLPNNVDIVHITFKEMKKFIQGKFEFQISLDRPYKLCDYKPAYGYIFEDEIKEYEFWGHCDLDIIVGNLDKFLSKEILSEYDKIFCLGHMILYRNNKENNRLFMKEINGRKLYLESFRNCKTTIFDETHGDKDNINSIFEYYNKKVYTEDLSLNFRILPTRFTKTTFIYDSYSYDIEKYKKAIYVWDKGHILRKVKVGDKIEEEEFLYAHFQQRNMKVEEGVLDAEFFSFVPNCFCTIQTNEINNYNFKKISPKRICFHFFQIKKKNLEKKINKWRKK